MRPAGAAFLLLMTISATYAADNFALLSGTLRTLQAGACDGDMLALRCPPATSISIQLVQYGRLARQPDLCGSQSTNSNRTQCMDRGALKEVVIRCAGKQQCQLYVSPETFGVDPCPNVGKFVEVLYKCRPTEFRSLVVCSGERKTIYCGRDRVAIYAAVFGTKASGNVHCPQPPGTVLSDCQAGFTSEKLISQCQGRPTCDLEARSGLYGGGCPADHNMYLTATYTCLASEIFTDQYSHDPDEDYQQNMTEAPSDDQPVEETAEHYVPAAEMESHKPPHNVDAGQRSLLMYLLLGISGILLLVLGAVLGRLCFRYRYRHDGAGTGTTSPPPVLSDVTAASDVTTETGSDVTGCERPQLAQLDLTATTFLQPRPTLSGLRAPMTSPIYIRDSFRAGSVSPTVSEEVDRYSTVAFGDNADRPTVRFRDPPERYPTVGFGDRLDKRAVTFGDNMPLYKPVAYDDRRDDYLRIHPSCHKLEVADEVNVVPPHSMPRTVPPTVYFHS